MFKLRANPESIGGTPLNIARSEMQCCDGESREECKYKSTHDPFTDVASVVYLDWKGVEQTHVFDVPLTTVSDIRGGLTDLAKEAGYFERGVPTTSVTVTEGVAEVCIWGEFEVLKLVDSSDVEYLFEKACETYLKCKYQTQTMEISEVSVNGVLTPLSKTYVAGTDAAADLEAELAALDVISATATEADGVYTLTICLEGKGTIAYGEKTFAYCDCNTDYKSASESGK